LKNNNSKQPAKSRATGRVTLTDVAREAGVSPITVSRALRGQRAVAPELAIKAKQAAEKLGYSPDPAARALASRTSSHVAVLVPALSNALFVDVLEAIQKTLRPAGYQTLIGITHYDPAEEELLLREQLLHRPAGILVTGLDHSAATEAAIARSGLPCVHMMELSPDTNLYCVGLKQTEAAITLTNYLLSTGCKRIAFAASQLDPRTLQRLDGWRQAMQAQGYYLPTLEWKDPAPSSIALGAKMFEQIVATRPSIEAIFFCNDDLAQGALLAAQRLNIKVPQQVAIAGFNDLTGSDQVVPALTTISTPRWAIGEAAAQMLVQLMNGTRPQFNQVDLGFKLIKRGSTAQKNP
jgi:LacI family transcriptional regulator, gluconate utilization system Gnt-I transcriptional repressor